VQVWAALLLLLRLGLRMSLWVLLIGCLLLLPLLHPSSLVVFCDRGD
jgi:hypothetical protein